jgi:hypothetical protein
MKVLDGVMLRRQRINRAQLLTDQSTHSGVDTKQRSSIPGTKEAHSNEELPRGCVVVCGR